MGTDELKTEINEVVWRYDCIHDELRIFCKRWPYRKEFSKRTIRTYMSKINKIIPKIFDLRTFNPIEGDGRSVEEILISMINDEANSNGDVRVIRSALGHAISELMFEIIYDLRDNHFPIKNEQALETFTRAETHKGDSLVVNVVIQGLRWEADNGSELFLAERRAVFAT